MKERIVPSQFRLEVLLELIFSEFQAEAQSKGIRNGSFEMLIASISCYQDKMAVSQNDYYQLTASVAQRLVGLHHGLHLVTCWEKGGVWDSNPNLNPWGVHIGAIAVGYPTVGPGPYR